MERNLQKIFINFIGLIFLYHYPLIAAHAITNCKALQIGDNIACTALAKILSIKYDIPFHYTPFPYSSSFIFAQKEQAYNNEEFQDVVQVNSEKDIIAHINKPNVLFLANLKTMIEAIDPKYIEEVKSLFKPNNEPELLTIPLDKITIAVHIRKGNGGGEYYDGEQYSVQEFDFDRTQVLYLNDYFNYPFDWETYQRIDNQIKKKDFSNNDNLRIVRKAGTSVSNPHCHLIDTLPDWQTKFPPIQYYIDQLNFLMERLKNKPLYIQIFTDDKDPVALINIIQNKVQNTNITIHYEDNRSKSHATRIIEDLFNMARFDILIRSQSYFARAAELIGNFKIVMYPLHSYWDQKRSEKKLIMDIVVIK